MFDAKTALNFQEMPLRENGRELGDAGRAMSLPGLRPASHAGLPRSEEEGEERLLALLSIVVSGKMVFCEKTS